MRSFVPFTLLLVLFLWGCAPAATPAANPFIATLEPRTLYVFAAASLTDAFTELGKNFETTNPGVKVSFNFAGSQALRTQIEEGAPADVFASANKTEMDALVTSAHVAKDSPKNFLSNQLVVILPADNPAGLEKLEDLARPGVKIVLAAEEVPAGKYARQLLENLNGKFGDGYQEKVLANVVSNEDNVRQVTAKVQLGEADAGIVYASDAIASPDLKRMEIPSELNVIAKYPVASIIGSPNAELANKFIAYVLSDEGKAVLKKWGFSPPQ
jgi:molybdate transport system substrate-binding protein